MSLQHWPESERPREQLLKLGAASLSEAELLFDEQAVTPVADNLPVTAEIALQPAETPASAKVAIPD